MKDLDKVPSFDQWTVVSLQRGSRFASQFRKRDYFVPNMDTIRFRVNNLSVEIHADKEIAGMAAAQAAAQALRQLAQRRDTIGVVFATGASQLETLRAITSIPNLPWSRVSGFHMDEYIGIESTHPASFRRYLRENLTSQVHMQDFSEIDGSAPDPDAVCREYAKRLRLAEPQLCLLGIGENGHLAFNDPGVANFVDPDDMKVVKLDLMCRCQQAAEGWFPSVDEVPERALSLTIPTLFRIPKLIASVPGKRKAQIVRRALEEKISESCPATILRRHPNATLYLDEESAAELLSSAKCAQAASITI